MLGALAQVGASLADAAKAAGISRVVFDRGGNTYTGRVAAFADAQVAVSKVERDGRTTAQAQLVTGPERVGELSRMLSGQPDSATARRHAEELLQMAAPGLAVPGLAVPGPRAGGPRRRRRPELR